MLTCVVWRYVMSMHQGVDIICKFVDLVKCMPSDKSGDVRWACLANCVGGLHSTPPMKVAWQKSHMSVLAEMSNHL